MYSFLTNKQPTNILDNAILSKYNQQNYLKAEIEINGANSRDIINDVKLYDTTNVTYSLSDKTLLKDQQELYARSKGGQLVSFANYQENYFVSSVHIDNTSYFWSSTMEDNHYSGFPNYSHSTSTPPDPSNVLHERRENFYC